MEHEILIRHGETPPAHHAPGACLDFGVFADTFLERSLVLKPRFFLVSAMKCWTQFRIAKLTIFKIFGVGFATVVQNREQYLAQGACFRSLRGSRRGVGAKTPLTILAPLLFRGFWRPKGGQKAAKLEVKSLKNRCKK